MTWSLLQQTAEAIRCPVDVEVMVDVTQLEALAVSHRAQGLQLGSQLFVSVAGQPVVHFADGQASEGQPLTTSSVLRWYECGMPLVSVLIGKLLERGKIRLDDP